MTTELCALDPSTDRSGGVLLHPSSLPSPTGIGDLGPEAHRLVALLGDAAVGLWQTLPLGPTGFGDSPYQSFSSFAGNPKLVSPVLLARRGLVDPAEVERLTLPPGPVDFPAVAAGRVRLFAALDAGWREPPGYRDFVERESWWLEDHALFMALKEVHGGRPWADWEAPLRDRHPDALREARARYGERIERERRVQFCFFTQLAELRAAAARWNVRLVGDLPFYVAWDSSDVWTRRHLFRLDATGRPTVVAGVPPDYFSPTGQLWGNPIYAWEAHRAEGYRWWIDRLGAALRFADIVRVDHFRAFADYWEVPADAPTAVTGRWVDGPGLPFFETVAKTLGPLPLIAEDLGELSPKVPALLEATGFPGMRILQFAFADGPDDPFLPHRYPQRAVGYTGTHDNDTTLGWWQHASDRERAFALDYLGSSGDDIVGDLIAALWASPAVYAVVPAQDLLRLGSEARMNTPGTVGGSNWRWRLLPEQLSGDLAAELAELGPVHHRSSHDS